MEIYIVEDDLSVINNLEEIMEQHQLGNICGDSGEEAPDVSRIMAQNPDIILVDLLMPQKDGIQVVRELREQGCKAKCIMPGLGQGAGWEGLRCGGGFLYQQADQPY